MIYERECSVTEYKVVERSGTYVDVACHDSFYDESVRKRVFLEPASIWLRVGDAREISTPVELGELEAEHACLRELLQVDR